MDPTDVIGVPMDQAAYTSLAPWFGAKRTLAPKIVEAIGPHRCYWEPFCGSMAVLLAKAPVPMETANDLHGDLVNLARVVRDEGLSGRLHWKLRRTMPAEPLFRESLAAIKGGPAPSLPDVDPPCVGRAYCYFVASWLGMNGVAGTATTNTNFARRFTSNGGSPAGRFAAAVDSLPWWHERLRSVLILSECGVGLCEKIEDKAGTAVYCDPPYFVKGKDYLHDFAAADHERLAAALGRFRLTRVVVSYYAHPDLHRLYPGWARIDATVTKAMVQAGARKAGRVDAPEVLLVNQVAAAVPPSLFGG